MRSLGFSAIVVIVMTLIDLVFGLPFSPSVRILFTIPAGALIHHFLLDREGRLRRRRRAGPAPHPYGDPSVSPTSGS